MENNIKSNCGDALGPWQPMSLTNRAYIEDFKPHANPGTSSASYAHIAPESFADTPVHDHHGDRIHPGDIVVRIFGSATSPRYLVTDISPFRKNKPTSEERVVVRKLISGESSDNARERDGEHDIVLRGTELSIVRRAAVR